MDTPAAVGGEGAHDVLDDAEERDEFLLGAVEVVRRQQPEGDDLDVRLGAPAEELLDLVGTGTVAVLGGGTRGLRPAPVAVHDDADVLGHLSVVQVAFHPACVQPDQKAAQLVAQVHVIVSPSVRCGPRGAQPTPAGLGPLSGVGGDGGERPGAGGGGEQGEQGGSRQGEGAREPHGGTKKRAGPWGRRTGPRGFPP